MLITESGFVGRDKCVRIEESDDWLWNVLFSFVIFVFAVATKRSVWAGICKMWCFIKKNETIKYTGDQCFPQLMSLILWHAPSFKIPLTVYHHRKWRDTIISDKLRCRLAAVQSKHEITNKEFPSNALLLLNVNADYFNYLPWSFLSKNSTPTTASEINCCVHIRYLTILFQKASLRCGESYRGTFHGVSVLLDSWQEKSETTSHLVWQSHRQHWPVTSWWQPRTNECPSSLPDCIFPLPSAPAVWSIQLMLRANRQRAYFTSGPSQ